MGGLGQIGKWAKQVDPIISSNHISSALVLVSSVVLVDCLYFHMFTWPPETKYPGDLRQERVEISLVFEIAINLKVSLLAFH